MQLSSTPTSCVISFSRFARLSLWVLPAVLTLASSVQAMSAISKGRKDYTPPTMEEKSQGHRDGTVIVKLKPGVAAQTAEAEETASGYVTTRRFEALAGTRVLEIPDGLPVSEAVRQLMATNRYEWVNLNRIRRSEAVPNDPDFSQQWALQNTGQNGGSSGADISAVQAWTVNHDAANVIVAVIDTGVRLNHPDLVDNLWTNTAEIAGNGVDDDNDGYIDDVHGINATVFRSGDPNDTHGHGTHVAGIIGATGNNGVGVTGVAWKVQIMALKAARDDSTDVSFETADVLECYQYAIQHGAKIINASFGTDPTVDGYSDSELGAIAAAKHAGIIIVASAGNDTANLEVTPVYPACFMSDNIVTVGSSDNSDSPSYFTNYGAGSCDLLAPGSSILSTSFATTTGAATYAIQSGTSASAPYVSGTLALMRATFPTDTYRQLINRLLRSTDLGLSLVGYSQTGGRLNLYRALTSTDNRPFNDDFSASAVLADANATVRSNNSGATRESGEPYQGANTAANSSLWWTWTATVNGQVTLDATESSIDPIVAVYTGTKLASLQNVSGSYSSSRDYSRFVFTAVQGTTYSISLASRTSVTGQVVLKLSAVPDNDAFANAQLLEGLSPTVSGLNYNTSREAGEYTLLGYQGGHSVWYKWVAPKTAAYQASALSSYFDPILGVYTGSSVSTLTQVAANDDPVTDGSNKSPICSFNAVSGTTYYFRVDSKKDTDLGWFTLYLDDSVWQFAAGSPFSNTPAVGPDGTLYVCEDYYTLHAIAADGTEKWKRDLEYGQESSSISVAGDGTVIVPDYDGIVRAINPDNTTRWAYDTTDTITNSPAIAKDGTVYIKSMNGTLHAIDPSTGNRKWTYNTNTTATTADDTYGGPSIAGDGTIYVPGRDNALHAVSPTGALVWRFATDSGVYTNAAIDSSGNLYFASLNGTFYSVTASGSLRWSKAYTSSISSSPVIAKDGTVYFGGYDHKLHALSGSDGSEKWAYTMGDEVRACSPAIADDGTVYMGCYDGRIYAISATGTLVRYYSTAGVFRGSPVIQGSRLYAASYDYKVYAFDIGSASTQAQWPMKGANPRHLGRLSSDAEAVIITPPKAASLATGGSLSLSVAAAGSGLTYQWYKDGQAIPGANAATYAKAGLTTADAGSYTVSVSGGAVTVLSSPAQVTVANLVRGRIYALSTRGFASRDASSLIVGIAMAAGSDGKQKSIIFRGLGPTLKDRSISNYMPNPQIQLYHNGVVAASNKDWDSAIRAKMLAVGLTDLATGSADSGMLSSLDPGNYAALISDEGTGSGIVLGEMYDADTTPASDPARATQGRLIGISSRAMISVGDNILTAAFVFDGDAPMTLLIQGVGPTLTTQGVTNPLAKPHLDLYKNGAIIYSDDKWGGSADILQAEKTSGATQMISANSADSALLVTVQPGAYTAVLQSGDGTSGVGLVEIYQVQ